ncbi:DMT family transporter [Compostimonas suwonensis]|nr:EamA family transporter [Compostimonas suwonensis]
MVAILCVLLAALCFGTTGTAQAFGPADASSLSVGAARILIGGGALAAIAGVALLRSRAGAGRGIRPTVTRGAGTRTLPAGALVAVGALGVLAYQPAFFLGTAVNGVAVGTIVALGSAPVITGALQWALTRRFPGAIWLVATIVATVGVALLSGVTDAAGSAVDPAGLLSSLAAGASYAVYTLASKALLNRGWTPIGAMGGVFGVAAALSLPLLLLTDTSWLATGPGVAMALWLGLVTTALAYLLFARGLAALPAATVSTLTLAEPLTASLLGILVLGERLPATAVLGLVVLAAGLVILAVPARRRPGEVLP